jgi:serine/threonine protein kinase
VDSQPDADIRIAGYRIEARVGRGGMGEVFRAVQLNLDRRVALKILAPRLADDERFRRRFLRESRIAASIDHPSIIPIYETGEDGGLLYIAMRYVDGPDLATVLRRAGRLAPARAMAIMTQVASALDAAHQRGLVHRDVKPANILLASGPGGSDSHCYLCDFGLIKQVDSEQVVSALTATDQFVGTIPYVAPEQIEGTALDGRTDVYSLGCVVFHCLTGSVPFQGSNDVEVVFAHISRPPPSLSDRAPDLPPTLDPIVARAMAKSIEDRWPTCSSLVAALSAQFASHPPLPTPDDDITRSMVHPRPPGRASPGAARAPTATPAPTNAPAAAAAAGAAGAVAGATGAAPAVTPTSDPDAVGEVSDPGVTTEVSDPGVVTEIVAPGPPDPPPLAPPLARPPGPPGRPVSTQSAPSPPEGERNRPERQAPGVVHSPGRPEQGYRDGRRRGRWWLTALAAVILPVGVYLAAVQLFGALREPQVDAAATTALPPPGASPTCRWTRPEVGTPARSAPLAAIRAHMGWTDRFVVEEMRTWTGPDGNRRWYVKAHQENTPSRRGRWLVGQQSDGQQLVLATAPFTTKGYAARDWRAPDGERARLTGVTRCLAGT